jgi:hypothetical protein
MPFAGKFRCFAFTYASIRQNAPRCSGVYVISNSKEWLFIGAADDLQSALHKHLMETGTLLKSKAPTGFTFEACDPAARQGFLDELVTELHPPCNRADKAPTIHSARTR